jgi:hypothetical protein
MGAKAAHLMVNRKPRKGTERGLGEGSAPKDMPPVTCSFLLKFPETHQNSTTSLGTNYSILELFGRPFIRKL